MVSMWLRENDIGFVTTLQFWN